MKHLLLGAALFTTLFGATAQTADEIVDKHITALGGKEALLKLNTLTMEGTMNVMGNDISVKMAQVQNKGQRQDIITMGMNGYAIVTYKEGWSYMPFMGQTKPEPVPADQIKEALDDLDIQGNLLNYKEKGHTVEYLGTVDVEGTECHKLKVTRKTSGDQTMYIDPKSFMIVRTVTKRNAMGQEMEMKVDYSDYKPVSGIMLPHSITQQFGTIVISSVKVNEPVDDKMFQPAQ
jgi:outer membrane lipoprotein-sorting protein